jgi:hypothetical protein
MLRFKQHRFIWVGIVVLGVILLGMPAVYAGDAQPQPDPAADEASLQADDALEEIALNREAVIIDLAERWGPELEASVESISQMLHGATNEQLLAVDEAYSYEEVLEVLGSTTQDLVYTPVTPCKIVDTRSGGGGFISAGSTRYYQTYGNLAYQGGSNCTSPRGEPSAVHISVVAVNPNGKGNIKAHPYGTSSSAGLSVNFAVIGTNLANAGTVKVTRNSTYDISISALYSGAHVTIQVLGYYYPVDESDFKVQYVKREKSYLVAPNTSYTDAACACPTGYYVVGGGWWSRRNVSPHYHDKDVHAYTDRPNGTSGWIVGIRNDTGYYHWLTVYAICLKLN